MPRDYRRPGFRAVVPGLRVKGARSFFVLDPRGNHWFIATFREDVSKEEMERRMAAMKAG